MIGELVATLNLKKDPPQKGYFGIVFSKCQQITDDVQSVYKVFWSDGVWAVYTLDDIQAMMVHNDAV